ncbi:LLM class flavin-dependent oxidoreductase [Williamsia sp. SKLECPSW1]
MLVSCAFTTDLDSPEHVAIAEDLGYHRAWLYDTPQQSADVWVTLAAAAAKTDRIGLGPGVLVPSLRHPVVNASATANLAALAPGRVAVAFGTGFTARRAMGYSAITWAYMERYIEAYRGLLRGEVVTWEDVQMQMLHPRGHAPDRPIDVEVYVGAIGPKGNAVASRLGDGLFVTQAVPQFAADHDQVAFLTWGTVLDEGETTDSDHVKDAVGPGWALNYHATYEFAGRDAVAGLPGGAEWLATLDKEPEDNRHLVVHRGHAVALNAADEAAWAAGGHALVAPTTLTGTADEIRARLTDLEAQGVTEIVLQPCGSDIRRELERFVDAASA